MPHHDDEIQEVIEEFIEAITKVVEALNDSEERRRIVGEVLRMALPMILMRIKQRVSSMILSVGDGMGDGTRQLDEPVETRSTGSTNYMLFSNGGDLALKNIVQPLVAADSQSRLQLTLLNNAADGRDDADLLAALGMPEGSDIPEFRAALLNAISSVTTNNSGITINIPDGMRSPYSAFLRDIGA